MTLEEQQLLLAVGAVSATTYFLRAVPSLAPRRLINHPITQQAASFMPLVIMTILVVHAFNGTTLGLNPEFVAMMLGVLMVGNLQLTLRIPLFSILGGVAVHVSCLTWL